MATTHGGLMKDPPEDCKKGSILNGKHWVDMSICAFFCKNQCELFLTHQKEKEKDRVKRSTN